jgi:hypothetical protein
MLYFNSVTKANTQRHEEQLEENREKKQESLK